MLIPVLVRRRSDPSAATTQGARRGHGRRPDYRPKRRTHTVVVLVGTVNRGVLDAVQYARELAPDRLIALSVVTGPDEQEQLAEAWERFEMPIPVHTILSPYRELTGPVLSYLDELDAETIDDVITVIIPEFVTSGRRNGCTTSPPSRSRPDCSTGRTPS